METIYLHLPRQRAPGPIDITPVPWWRRATRTALAALTLLLAVPVLWLLGTVLALLILVGGAAMLAFITLRPAGGSLLRGTRLRASGKPPF